MTPVRWSRLSREDLNRAVDHIAESDFPLADTLLEQAAHATIFLATSPRAGARYDTRGRRKWRLGKLPYALLYHVNAERVLILRFAHLRSDWQSLA